MRWRSSVPYGVPHLLQEDDVYEGYHLPKGSHVFALEWYSFFAPSLLPFTSLQSLPFPPPLPPNSTNPRPTKGTQPLTQPLPRRLNIQPLPLALTFLPLHLPRTIIPLPVHKKPFRFRLGEKNVYRTGSCGGSGFHSRGVCALGL